MTNRVKGVDSVQEINGRSSLSNLLKLGKVIKSYRLAAEESVEDLSGAVEVAPEYISKIESGKSVPPEDILLLIINHFEIQENEAIELFQIAGYENPKVDKQGVIDPDEKQISISIPSDKPILYTDRVHVISSDYGVVLNFIQSVGPNGPAQVVSRVGMSRDHAKNFLEALKKSIEKKEG